MVVILLANCLTISSKPPVPPREIIEPEDFAPTGDLDVAAAPACTGVVAATVAVLDVAVAAGRLGARRIFFAVSSTLADDLLALPFASFVFAACVS